MRVRGASLNGALATQLERSRALGFLGPGPIEDHVDHASGFVRALEGVAGRVIDLGSGGGVPGLLLAVARPDLDLVLLDAAAKRCRFLEQAVAALGGADRVTVAQGRAEVLGRGPLRGTAAAVIARSFGPPAATAECAAPLLQRGGLLVVSEPPGGPPRWPAGPLAELGLAVVDQVVPGPRLQLLRQVTPCPAAYPRRDGVPTKRPLF